MSGADPGGPAFRTAHELARSLAAAGVSHRHAVELTRAFKQDAVKLRYADWDDLIAYCNYSAAPVGRFLIDLHGESSAAYPASDALCNALQVLNHLQDCGDDYRGLDRVYLPQDWMTGAGAEVEDLGGERSSAALRSVLDRCLDATERLLVSAGHLPGQLRDARFAMEAAAIVAIAGKLGRALRRRDPLAERVVLTRVQFGVCCGLGIGRVIARRTLGRLRPGGGRAFAARRTGRQEEPVNRRREAGRFRPARFAARPPPTAGPLAQ